jgi:hypothetical protein
VVYEAGEFELGSAARVGSYDQASADAVGRLLGGLSLVVASDMRLRCSAARITTHLPDR